MANEKGREGFGDDQGTRVGRPTPGADRSTGAGAEAAEGIHSADGDRSHNDRTALEGKRTGASEGGSPAGSEPATSHDEEHESGYGGAGGAPKGG